MQKYFSKINSFGAVSYASAEMKISQRYVCSRISITHSDPVKLSGVSPVVLSGRCPYAHESGPSTEA